MISVAFFTTAKSTKEISTHNWPTPGGQEWENLEWMREFECELEVLYESEMIALLLEIAIKCIFKTFCMNLKW